MISSPSPQDICVFLHLKNYFIIRGIMSGDISIHKFATDILHLIILEIFGMTNNNQISYIII